LRFALTDTRDLLLTVSAYQGFSKNVPVGIYRYMR